MEFPREKIPHKAYIYCSIFFLSNRLQLLGDRRREEISTKQCFVLANAALFDDFQLNLKDIASLVGTSSQNIKKIINILVKKEYMKLKKDETDARNLRIALTNKGKSYYMAQTEQENKYIERLFEGMNPKDIDYLYQGLCQLMNNVIKKQGEESHGNLY